MIYLFIYFSLLSFVKYWLLYIIISFSEGMWRGNSSFMNWGFYIQKLLFTLLVSNIEGIINQGSLQSWAYAILSIIKFRRLKIPSLTKQCTKRKNFRWNLDILTSKIALNRDLRNISFLRKTSPQVPCSLGINTVLLLPFKADRNLLVARKGSFCFYFDCSSNLTIILLGQLLSVSIQSLSIFPFHPKET